MKETNTTRFNDRPRTERLTLLPEPVDRVGFVTDEPLSVLEGDPRALVRELYGEGAGRSGLWEVTPGAFVAENDGFAEYMHILEGRGTVLSDDGSVLELQPGVKFIAPSGWRGRWVVTETIRKIYVIWTEPQSDAVPLSGESAIAEEEEDAIAKVMARFLASVSFESGALPDYSSLPSQFTEGPGWSGPRAVSQRASGSTSSYMTAPSRSAQDSSRHSPSARRLRSPNGSATWRTGSARTRNAAITQESWRRVTASSLRSS